MGNFSGHAIPGTFFIIVGVWWTFSAWWEYFRSKAQSRSYVARCTYPLPGIFRAYSFEGVIKIVGSAYCLRGEIITGIHEGKFVSTENTQHLSMDLFYMFSGIVDVLTNSGFPLPPGTDYVALFFAVAVEGLLFNFHLHGRPPLNVMVHTMLIYVTAAEATCIMVELTKPHSVLAALGRAYFRTLQGTWLWQLAFMLFGRFPDYQAWDQNDHDNMMLAASVFAWHMLGGLLNSGFFGLLAWGISRTCKHKDQVDQQNYGHSDLASIMVQSGKKK